MFITVYWIYSTCVNTAVNKYIKVFFYDKSDYALDPFHPINISHQKSTLLCIYIYVCVPPSPFKINLFSYLIQVLWIRFYLNLPTFPFNHFSSLITSYPLPISYRYTYVILLFTKTYRSWGIRLFSSFLILPKVYALIKF